MPTYGFICKNKKFLFSLLFRLFILFFVKKYVYIPINLKICKNKISNKYLYVIPNQFIVWYTIRTTEKKNYEKVINILSLNYKRLNATALLI